MVTMIQEMAGKKRHVLLDTLWTPSRMNKTLMPVLWILSLSNVRKTCDIVLLSRSMIWALFITWIKFNPTMDK